MAFCYDNDDAPRSTRLDQTFLVGAFSLRSLFFLSTFPCIYHIHMPFFFYFHFSYRIHFLLIFSMLQLRIVSIFEFVFYIVCLRVFLVVYYLFHPCFQFPLLLSNSKFFYRTQLTGYFCQFYEPE